MGVRVRLGDGILQNVSSQGLQVGEVSVENIQLKTTPAVVQHLPDGGGGGAWVVGRRALTVGEVSPVQPHGEGGIILVGDDVGLNLYWGQLLNPVPVESSNPVVAVGFFLKKCFRDQDRVLRIQEFNGGKRCEVVRKVAAAKTN